MPNYIIILKVSDPSYHNHGLVGLYWELFCPDSQLPSWYFLPTGSPSIGVCWGGKQIIEFITHRAMNEFLGSVQVLCKQKINLCRNKDSNVYALAYESIGKVAYLHITFLLNHTRTIIYMGFSTYLTQPPFPILSEWYWNLLCTTCYF